MSKLDEFFWNLSFPQEGNLWISNAKLNIKLFKESISRVLYKLDSNKQGHRPDFVPNPLCKPCLKHLGFNNSSTFAKILY